MRLLLALATLALSPIQAASDKVATSKGDLEIVAIEHATFVMKWDKAVIFVDPVGGADRFKDCGKPDLILVTDIHGDHLSADTLAAQLPDDRNVDVYFIGPKPFMQAVYSMGRTLGVLPERLRCEFFGPLEAIA